MKNKIILIGIIFLAFAVTITTVAQKGKENKGNNKEQGNNGKGNKDNGKGNGNKGDHGNKDNNNGKGNDDKNNNGNDKDKDKNDKDDIKIRMKDGFVWDTETFKDRRNIRNNMDKVTICHKPGKNNNNPGVTITVSSNALKAHMNHGDVQGNCPAVANSTFSNVFLDRRTDYYTVLQNGQEQVLYSRSILDYALERLTGARSQLVVLQNNNAPAADIERKRLLVVDLEQNVSLLQTLIGVTANIVADRLMN